MAYAHKAPTKAERDARDAKIADLKTKVGDLAEQVNGAQGDEVFDAYLGWIARFHRYSVRNMMLICWQRPMATQVAGFRRWQQEGRNVKKGEKGLAILVPWTCKRREEDIKADPDAPPSFTLFRVGHVFDLAQTEGADVPFFFSPLTGDVSGIMAGLDSYATAQGIKVERTATGRYGGWASEDGIKLNDEHSDNLAVRTFVHELAHCALHIGAKKLGAFAKALIEGEAEAVSVVVLRHLGFDTGASGAAYIRHHGGGRDLILGSLDRIAKTAGALIDAVEGASATADGE